MPLMNTAPAALDPIKMLLLGDSGTGKTGALASLALAGYNLRILDFDKGLDIIKSALAGNEEALARVAYETFTDKFKMVNGKAIVDGMPQAWSRAMNLLDRWRVGKEGEPGYYDLGPVKSWGLRDILIMDSLTFGSMAAFRLILAMNGRGGVRPYPADFGECQNMVEGCLQLFNSDAIRCNIIVLSHVNYMEIEVDSGEKDKDGKAVMRVIDNKGLPMAIGKALSPKIPTYFNSTIIAFREGTGSGEKRYLSTRGMGIVEAKTSKVNAPARLPLATGLADYFKLFHPSLPPATAVPEAKAP